MKKQYDTQEQIDAFNIYVKQNPAGRQVHHTGTLGYDDDEWKAFQEGWNAALAQPKPVYGYCPECGAKGIQRERRPYGFDRCINGHIYPSGIAIPPRAVKTYHEGKPVYVASHPRTFDDYGNKIV